MHLQKVQAKFEVDFFSWYSGKCSRVVSIRLDVMWLIPDAPYIMKNTAAFLKREFPQGISLFKLQTEYSISLKFQNQDILKGFVLTAMNLQFISLVGSWIYRYTYAF